MTSELVDLAAFDLADLSKLDRPILAAALARIVHEIDRPDEAVAGFQSSI
jgi:FXSXX-COOH protein